MRTLRLLALAAVVGTACRLDQLIQSAGPAPPPSAFGAAGLVFSAQPDSARAGQRLARVQVTVRDSSHAPATRFSGTVTVTLYHGPRAAVLEGRSSVPAVNGVASFTDLRIDVSGSGYTLIAVVEGLPAATSAPFDVAPGPPTRLAFVVQPRTALTDSAIQPPVVVAAFDAFGNAAADFTGDVALRLDRDGSALSNATLQGDTVLAASGGAASFGNLRVNQAGTGYTLRATAAGLRDATSAAFDVSLAPPTQLVFTEQPRTTPVHQTLPAVQVSAIDASNNFVPNYTGLVTIALDANPANGSLTGTLSVNAIAGIATFGDLSIDSVGTGYTLRAIADGLTGATSAPFDITP